MKETISCTYNLSQSYDWNYENGPIYGQPVAREEESAAREFLGYKVNSTLGVASGPLLNSRWISLYASLGFDLLTYKTVRTCPWPSYPWPNIVLLDMAGQVSEPGEEEKVWEREAVPGKNEPVSIAVSFGMPSAAPEVWQRDVSKAKGCLGRGQLLIVSVVGTPVGHGTLEELAQDFARCAQMAVEAGADVVEANFSCPNVKGLEGRLFARPDEAAQVARCIREEVGKFPFLLKIGTLWEDCLIKELLVKVHPFVDGLTVTNGLVKTVVKKDGSSPAFGDRVTAGVVGACVRESAVETLKKFRCIAEENGIVLTWLAVGGVSSPQDVERLHRAGGDAVLVATAALFFPELARETKRHFSTIR